MGDDQGAGTRRLNRRELIQRAAIGGAVWSMPTIVATATPAAAAGTIVAGCYKYMHDWRWADEVLGCNDEKGFDAQNDAVPCAQNVGENHEKIDGVSQVVTDPNCCQERNPDNDDNDFKWWEIPDLPEECIEVTSTQACATSEYLVSVTFKITAACPTCYLTDGTVAFDASGDLVPGTYDCDSLSISHSNFGSSKFFKEITFTYSGDKVPVWFKFWVGCGLTTSDSDQYVPNTDCPHINGVSPDSPVGI